MTQAERELLLEIAKLLRQTVPIQSRTFMRLIEQVETESPEAMLHPTVTETPTAAE